MVVSALEARSKALVYSPPDHCGSLTRDGKSTCKKRVVYPKTCHQHTDSNRISQGRLVNELLWMSARLAIDHSVPEVFAFVARNWVGSKSSSLARVRSAWFSSRSSDVLSSLSPTSPASVPLIASPTAPEPHQAFFQSHIVDSVCSEDRTEHSLDPEMSTILPTYEQVLQSLAEIQESIPDPDQVMPNASALTNEHLTHTLDQLSDRLDGLQLELNQLRVTVSQVSSANRQQQLVNHQSIQVHAKLARHLSNRFSDQD